MNPVETATYVVSFAAVGALFVGIALGVGGLLRPNRPTPLKQATYECGEITIGPSDLQFDLRFYVVALVFLVFEVELAFFFPWARVFGKLVRLERGWATGDSGELADYPPAEQTSFASTPVLPVGSKLRPKTSDGSEGTSGTLAIGSGSSPPSRQFLWLAASELGLFLAIVLVGFFYLWHQGDLDWVHSLEALPGAEELHQPGLSAVPLADHPTASPTPPSAPRR